MKRKIKWVKRQWNGFQTMLSSRHFIGNKINTNIFTLSDFSTIFVIMVDIHIFILHAIRFNHSWLCVHFMNSFYCIVCGWLFHTDSFSIQLSAPSLVVKCSNNNDNNSNTERERCWHEVKDASKKLCTNTSHQCICFVELIRAKIY